MPTMTAPAFPVTIDFPWTETGVIPPRCRVPRNIVHPDQAHTAYIQTATPEEAPVAFVAHPGDSTVEQAREWRYYNGQLFEAYMPDSRQTEIAVAGSGSFPSERRYSDYSAYGQPNLHTTTLDEAKQNIDAHFSGFLIVNGEVWQNTTAEPCYRVETYGMGDTSVYLSISDSEWTARHGEWKYFNANERQEAIEAGVAMVPTPYREKGRANLESGASLEVLIPEAVKFQPDRIAAKGRAEISNYEYRNSTRTREAFKAAAGKMDAKSVGRGETGYAEYLEHAAAALLAEAEKYRANGDDF